MTTGSSPPARRGSASAPSIAAVDRKFITRDQGLERLETIVSFLERAPRYHGAWSHYYNDETGETMSLFGMYDNGGDIIETSYIIQGLLTARGYFNGKQSREQALGKRITALWEAVEWDWYRVTPDSPFLYWHWSPQWGFQILHPLIGFNETVVTYLLAIASPTHPVPASMYYSGWASQDKLAQQYREGWSGSPDGKLYANGNTYFGIKLDVGVSSGGPLFFTHYIFMGFDPHALRDRYTDVLFREQPPHRRDQSRLVHRESHEVRGIRAERLGIDRKLRFQGLHHACAGPVERRRHDHAHRRAIVVSLYARSVDGRLQAFLPGPRSRALGHLRPARQLQPEPGLARLLTTWASTRRRSSPWWRTIARACCGARSCRILRSARC